MGNQEPDVESLAAWIPRDGNIKEVLENPRYPLPEGTNPIERRMEAVVGEILKRKISLTAAEAPETPKADEQRENFDIVVIGMQEATFDVEDPSKIGATRGIPTRIPSHALKAVTDLTKAKDHLGNVRDRQRQGSSDRNRLGMFSGISPTARNGGMVKPPMAPKPGTGSGTMRPPTVPRAVGGTPKGKMSSSSLLASDPAIADDCSTLSSRERRSQAQNDTLVLHALFQDHLPSYEHAVSYQRGQMRLMIFYNNEGISLEVISIKAQNTGKGGLANKGGIVSEVLVDGTTRLAFFTAHLEAHEGSSKYETRCNSVADIFRGTTSSITQCRCDVALANHFTFAMGDLNFRTRLPDHDPGSEEHISTTHAMVERTEWDELYKHDELCKAIENNHCFSGFSTPVCSFPPTFKVDRQKGYVYNDKRSPSYTDRILYTTGHRLQQKLKVLAYEPIDDFSSSDHKPIRGAFEVELNPCLKWRPTLTHRDTKRLSFSTGIVSRMSKLRMSSANVVEKPKKADRREYLHLFISSIHVLINKDSYKSSSDASSPSPFVCFVSTPAEALKRDTKSWQKLVHTMNPRVGKNLSNSDGTKAWPKTRRKRNTFDAFWENEEIQFKVRTHTNEGLPIDLSGAMIHLAVFDGKTSGNLLGIFSLNLASLITQSRQRADLGKTAIMTQTRKSEYPSVVRRSRGGSVRALFGGGSGRALFGGSVMHVFGPGKTTKPSAEAPESEKKDYVKGDETTEKNDKGSTGCEHASADGSESLNGNDSSQVKQAGKNKERPRRFRGQGKNRADENEEETGVLTSGPSAELLRRATSKKWLGPRRSSVLAGPIDVCSMKLSRPLRKYGQNIGSIKCTVDAWWLSDEDAEGRKMKAQDDNPPE